MTFQDKLAEFEGRHPATVGLLKTFSYEHLPPHLRELSEPVADLAFAEARQLNDGPELSTGLRRLREAKDTFVLQRLIDLGELG